MGFDCFSTHLLVVFENNLIFVIKYEILQFLILVIVKEF